MMSSREDLDIKLLERWRAGDRVAGERLLLRHIEGVRRYFRQRFPSAYEDLVQETLARIVERRNDFRGNSLFKTYLYRVARYVGAEHIRKNYRQEARFEPVDESLADHVEQGPFSLLVDREDFDLLTEAVQQLSLEQQEALGLYYWEQLTAKQVGEIVEVPEATVRSRLRLALRRLSREWTEPKR